jgi:hypothetical protein
MAGIGKWADEIRRKLGEWAQALEERLAPSPDPELIPVRVPVGHGTPQAPRR